MEDLCVIEDDEILLQRQKSLEVSEKLSKFYGALNRIEPH